MKAENKRLGRCSSCRFWKSASDLLVERTGPEATPEETEEARSAIQAELSQKFLSAEGAEKRGWCTAAEQGETGPGCMLAISLADQTPVRMISRHDHGCLNYQPRPRRAMTAPLPDFSKDMELGRCISCKFWSGADNESRTLHSFACYTNPEAREEESENEALALLSPPPLDPATAYTRGWCKAASNYTDNNPLDLVVDPVTGAVGALISSQEYACVRYVESPNPLVKKTPDWRILLNRKKLHILGASAPLDALLCSYMDPAKLLDHNNPLSPLHEHHPLNPRNPKSLYLNPNPAFAAYVLNPSVVNTLTDTEAIRKGAEVGRPTGVVDSHHPRVSILFSADPSKDPSEAHRQMSMQARLAQDFAARTMRMEADLPLAPGVSVSLSKPGDTRIVDDDRRKTPASDKYRKTPATGGFVDRRRLPS